MADVTPTHVIDGATTGGEYVKIKYQDEAGSTQTSEKAIGPAFITVGKKIKELKQEGFSVTVSAEIDGSKNITDLSYTVTL